MILKIGEWNIKTIAQVVYMCSAVTVAYAALEGANALRSQADAQWLSGITKAPDTNGVYLSKITGIQMKNKEEIIRAVEKLIDMRK